MKKFLTLISLSLLIFAACQQPPQQVNDPVKPSPVTQSEMQTQPEKGDTIATIQTNHGEIKMLLYTEKVPETTKNFIELSKQGKYANVPFHRVIQGFMIQGGDFENKNGTGGYTYEGPGTLLNDEVVDGLDHIYGAVSMAKTAMPNTAGSQFFIVQAQGGTPHLDGVHTVFGYVYDGMDVVEKIAAEDTDAMDRPLDEVVMGSVEISEF